MDEIPGSDKAFAELQEIYAAICETPFGLSKKLHTPLPPISGQLEASPYKYSIYAGGQKEKETTITAATRWILSYRSDCPLNRLMAMVSGAETTQADDMKQSLIDHITMVILLKRFPALIGLLQDLRYEVEFLNLDDLGGLEVVLLKTSIETFLPPDDFILQVTQLSGIPAFQEIIDREAINKIPDPLKSELEDSID